MLENLNELEKIGLAFISGLVAGQSLQEAEQEVEQEANNNNEKEMKVAVGKIEGEKAEKFIKMMKELGYNEGYIYDHDTPNCFSGQDYFPAEYPRRIFYTPNERGFEREIKKRIDYWDELRKKIKK